MNLEEEMAEALEGIEEHVRELSVQARAAGAQRAMQEEALGAFRAGTRAEYRAQVRESEWWLKSEWLIDNGLSVEVGEPPQSYEEWVREREETQKQAAVQHELNEQARKAKARESGRRQREKKKLREIEELRRELEEAQS